MEFKQFKRKVNQYMESETNRRDRIQEYITVGLNKYNENGDTSFLNYLIQSAVGVRSMPTKTLVGYIKDHANLSYGKLKDGKPGFKKSVKSEPVQVIQPTVEWYNWTGANHNADESDYDHEAAVIRLKKTISDKLDKGKVKDPDKARDALAYLEKIA